MRNLFAALLLGALFAPAVKAERWVTYGDFLDNAMWSPSEARKKRAAGECVWEQVDLDSVTRRGDIYTFNDRLYWCETPGRPNLVIGEKVICKTQQNITRSGQVSRPINTWKDKKLQAKYLRRLELVCQ